MNNKQNIVALIPAAGIGIRMGLGPKAFLKIGETTLLYRLVSALKDKVSRILVGVPKTHMQLAYEEVGKFADIYEGGNTRQETIFKLLQASTEPIILIHDVTRPFASPDLIQRVITTVRTYKAVGTFIPAAIPIGLQEGDFISQSFLKTKVLLPQLPQAYHRYILEQAYQYATHHQLDMQATWDLVLASGQAIKAVIGEETNIKLTTALDWEIAQKIIVPRLDWFL